MKFMMKRSQIYIRQNTNIPFHTEVDKTWIDRIKETTKEFSDDCKVTMEYIDDIYLRVNFWLPEEDDYHRMSNCLYARGQLKEVFKDAMRYTKLNGIAFAMPSWHLHKRSNTGIYHKVWYTNKKMSSDAKFFEESRDTLDARMRVLKAYMSLEDCVMNCAVYDYSHTVKHSYFLFTKRDEETERELGVIRKDAWENYEHKQKYNENNNIDAIVQKNITTNLHFHDFKDIPNDIFNTEFNQLEIPIL
jgi:hypothetical protein